MISKNNEDDSDEWTDDDIEKVEYSQSNDIKQNKKLYRSRRPIKFRTQEDYTRYDRPDMYVNSIFPYMGMHFSPDKTRQPLTLTTEPLPKSSSCRILRMTVDGGVEATGSELFDSLQSIVGQESAAFELPNEMDCNGQKLSLQYAPPHGDEMVFGSHPQDTEFLADRFLGTVFIGPYKRLQTSVVGANYDTTWQQKQTFLSWHRPLPSGLLPKNLNKSKLSFSHLKKTF